LGGSGITGVIKEDGKVFTSLSIGDIDTLPELLTAFLKQI
jgi:hypothetical protein